MKNILKKIGVIGLTIAVLAPFIELPKVKAANTDCTDHTLQQYFFLDRFNGGELKEYIDGRTTATMFADLFPNIESGKKINIINVELENLESKESLTSYWNEMTHLGGDYSYEKNSSIGKVGAYQTSSANDVEYYTSILHGYWGLCETSDCEAANLKNSAGWYDGNASNFHKNSVQFLFDDATYNLEDDNNVIVGGRFSGSRKLTGVNSRTYSDLKSYFEAAANRTDDELISEYNGNEYIGLQITREVLSSQYNNLTYGTDCSISGAGCESGKKYKKFNSANDFFENNNNFTYVEEKPDVLGSSTFYWPAILNVEYEICPTSSNPEGENWTLKYDLNTDDDTATGKPADQTEKVGASIKVDAKKPKRDGYTFQSWNTEKDGSGTKYNPDDTFKSDGTTETKYLYAQWGKGGTTDNEKTGVVSYVIGFISVGLVATGIYLVAKKKNLFKQI